MRTLQFFHQYLFFSLAAQLSNWEAPAWRASALSSSSESFWSLSKTLSTFTRMMSTTWREGGRKSPHQRTHDVCAAVLAMGMSGCTASWVQVKLTSSTWACVCWSLRLLVVLGGGGGAPLAPSAPGAPGAPGAPAGAESGADLQESWCAN